MPWQQHAFGSKTTEACLNGVMSNYSTQTVLICLVYPKQAIHHSISKFNLQEHTYCWQASHGQDSSPTCGNHEHLSLDPYRMSNFKSFNLKHIPGTFDDIMPWSMHDSMYCITITAMPRRAKANSKSGRRYQTQCV